MKIATLIQTGQYYSALSLESTFLPVRGTITFGDYIFHKGKVWTQAGGRPKIYSNDINLIFGKPIVESYYLEKKLQLIGIVIAESLYSSGVSIDNMTRQNLLIKYNIPFKEKINKKTIIVKKEGYVVNPVSIPHYDVNVKKLEHESEKHIKDDNTLQKYKNTIALFKHIKDNVLY